MFRRLNWRDKSPVLDFDHDETPPWRDMKTSPQCFTWMDEICLGLNPIVCAPLTWIMLRSLHLEPSSLLDQKLQRSIPFASSAIRALEHFPRTALILVVHSLSLSVIAILKPAASMNGRTNLYVSPFCILSLSCGLLSWSYIGGSPLEFCLLFVPSALSIGMTLGLLTERKVLTWHSPPLRSCGDAKQRNEPQDDTNQGHNFTYLSTSEQDKQNLHVTTVEAYPNLVQTEGSHQNPLITSSARSSGALDNTDTSQEATKAANLYWCTICEYGRSYRNISDWKKHEKEHMSTYVCMLKGPVDKTDGYITCSFCGKSDPSEKHLSAHDAHVCGPAISGSFLCKRRAVMVSHIMKRHRAQTKARAEALADRWKETTKKQVWSCGFCVCLLHTFHDRLKHIATHFERGQTLDEWDTTNVVEGLLLQYGIVNVWKKPMDWRSSDMIWKKDAVKQVQHDLELGPSDLVHAVALVRAVYDARMSKWQLPNDDKLFTSAPNYEAQGTGALVPRSGHTSTMNRVSQPSSYDEPCQLVNPAEFIHNGFPALVGDPMVTNHYGNRSFSFSGEGSHSIKDPWQLHSGHAWSSTADLYNGYSANQEQSDVSTGMHTWSTPAIHDEDPPSHNT